MSNIFTDASALLALALVLITYALTIRWRLLRTVSETALLPHDLPADAAAVEDWLATRDAGEAPLQPGAASAVQWATRAGERADVCVIFLHGWSASPTEVSPVDERLAAACGATLLRFRYTGHGLSPKARGGEAMAETQSDLELRRNAATAYALGRLLGRRVVLVGCSTGGALSLWLDAQAWVGAELAAIVLISPGIRIAMPAAAFWAVGWTLMLVPRAVSRRILEALNGGPRKKHKPLLPGERGDRQARCWTRDYPIESTRHPVGLFLHISAALRFEAVRVPVLAFANPGDNAVSFGATRDAVARMTRGALEVVDDAENAHVITGDILSPGTVGRLTRRATEFVAEALAMPRAQ